MHNAAEAEEWCRSNGVPTMLATPPSETAKVTSHHRPAPYERPSTSRTAKKQPSGSGSLARRNDEVDDESGWDVVFCDGACKGNGRKGSYAGVGVWWGHGDQRSVLLSILAYSVRPEPSYYGRNIAERCPGEQTNNRAELIVSSAEILDITRFSGRFS
jgi:ribonuclease HI